jgi:dihydrodipicolinate synthase/N-acetylneuraminate lyase
MGNTDSTLLYGITTAMVSLFKEDSSIDLESTRKFTEFLIEKGVHCLYPLGTTGEMYRLTADERKQIAEAVISQAKGRVPVYIHVGAMVQDEVLELAKHAAASGADGIGAVTPAYFGANPREIREFYLTLADSVPSGYPVYLYGIPQLAVNDLPTSLVEEIARERESIVGIKYSCADFRRTAEYARVRGGDFSVMHGSDALLPAIMSLGCDGTVSGCSSAYPEPYVAMYEAIQANDWDTARFHQHFADDYANVLRNGGNMAYFKAALCYRGIISDYQMRAPQLKLTADEEKAFFADLKDLDARYAEEKRKRGIQ